MIVHPHWKAIAAMSENRVIGKDGGIPWHLPEDFRWFKQTTLDQAVVMGRRTFESLGRPLPRRRNIVITRGGGNFEGAETLPSIEALEALPLEGDLFVIGGAEIYRQLLPRCGELLLSLVKRNVEGDTFFPEFEADFQMDSVIADHGDFEIRRYVRQLLQSPALLEKGI